jgi:hypothetical protein
MKQLEKKKQLEKQAILKNKILYRISLLCGLVPLTVGVSIFFVWWIARAFFAVDLADFQFYGFFWIMISAAIGLAGMILMNIVLYKNYPNYRKQGIWGIALILLNIPVLFLVLLQYSSIAEKAYIKIYNNSNSENIELLLKSSTFEKYLGHLEKNKSLVNSFIPYYPLGQGHESFPIIDTVTLIVKENQKTHYIIMPRVDNNECRILILNNKFQLTAKWD